MAIEVTAETKVAVSVCCENCKNIYNYEKFLFGLASSLSESKGEKTLTAEATKKLADKLRKCHRGRYLGVKKCSRCSHVQSWMLEDQKEDRETALFGWLLWSGLLALISIRIISDFRAELGIEKVWDWVVLPFLLLLGVGYYRLGKLVVRLRGLSPQSVRVEPSSSAPLKVTILQDPVVSVERKSFEDD
jgi:hypothetical protein